MCIHCGQQTFYQAVPVGSVLYLSHDLLVLRVRTASLRLQSAMNCNVSGRRRSRPEGGDCSGCWGGTGEINGKFSVPDQLQTRTPHIQRHSSEAVRAFSRTYNGVLVWDMQRSPRALRRREGSYPQSWGDTTLSDNPTTHCRYSAKISRFTADIPVDQQHSHCRQFSSL